MGSHEKYGDKYWRLDQTNGETLYLHADRIEISQAGAVVFWTEREDNKSFQNLMVGPGEWRRVAAASLVDGAMISVVHLDGDGEKE